MSFKDMVKSDIANVLMNTDEFAENHTVRYDGEVYSSIPIVLQKVKQSDRPIVQSDHMEGIFLVSAVAYIHEKDLFYDTINPNRHEKTKKIKHPLNPH